MTPTPATLVLVGSLFALIAAGWEESDGLKLAVSALVMPLLVGALIKTFSTTDFSAPRLVNGTPNQLAWIRIVVCLSAFILTVIENLPAISWLPVEFRKNQEFLHLLNALPGYETLLSNPHLLAILQWTTAILLLLGMVGLKTRVTLLLGGLCFFVLQAILRQYTYYFHGGLVPLYLLLVLPWTPCAAVWSLDHRMNPAKRKANRQSVGFGIYACYTVMAIVYLLSGLSKMRESGLDWFRGENIQHILLQDAMNPHFPDHKWKATLWLVQHDAPQFVYSIIGVVAVATELGYFTVLFSRTARIVTPAIAFGVHIGIWVFQHILFLDLLILQLVFLNADRLATFVVRRFRFHAAPEGFPVATNHGEEQRTVAPIALASMAIVITGMLFIWIFRIEYYPVSSWQLYSGSSSKSPIFYYKVVATLKNGSSIIVPPRDYSPAVMASGLPTLIKAIRSGGFEHFFSAYIERRDRQLAFGSPISTVDVQCWRWNYEVDPHDPYLGWITDRYVYDATAKRP
jgi:hypothetical protein